MAYSCDLEEDGAVLNDEYALDLGTALEEAALLASDLVKVDVSVVDDSAVLDDLAVVKTTAPSLVEAAVLDDTTSTAVALVTSTVESAVLDDTLIGAVSYGLEDTALLGSRLIDYTPLVETAVLNDAVTAALTAITLVSETAVLNDGTGTAVVALAAESAVVLGSALETSKVASLLVDTAVVTEVTTVNESNTDLASEVAVLNDETSSLFSYGSLIVEEALVSSRLSTPGYKTAYVAHGKQLAMSRYDKLQSDVIVAGRGYSDEGVYGFVQPSSIDAFVKTGKTDLGGETIKRIGEVYVSGEATSAAAVEVTVDTNGDTASYEYEFELRNNASTRNTRVHLGRGLRSRYWQFKFFNPNNDSFSLRTVTVDVAPSARRI